MLARSAARIRGSTAEAPGGLGASLPPATRPFRSMGTSAAKGIKPRIHRPRPALGLHLPEPPAAPLDPGMGMLRDAAHTGQILMRTGSSAHVQTESEQRRRGEEGDRTTLMRERAALSAGSGAVWTDTLRLLDQGGQLHTLRTSLRPDVSCPHRRPTHRKPLNSSPLKDPASRERRDPISASVLTRCSPNLPNFQVVPAQQEIALRRGLQKCGLPSHPHIHSHFQDDDRAPRGP